jgi:tetraacyldisaccharide-1-P 4'-kinase
VGKRVPGTQFEDHHCFTAKDMETVKVDAKGKNSTIIVTTQKDFLRRGGVDLVKELGTLHVLEGEINILQGAQILYKVVDSLLSSTGPKEIQVPV